MGDYGSAMQGPSDNWVYTYVCAGASCQNYCITATDGTNTVKVPEGY